MHGPPEIRNPASDVAGLRISDSGKFCAFLSSFSEPLPQDFLLEITAARLRRKLGLSEALCRIVVALAYGRRT